MAIREGRTPDNVRVPDAECTRIENKPREARLLGCSPFAGGDNTTTAARRASTAKRRDGDGSAVEEHVGAAPQESCLCHMPRALRFFRPGFRGLRADRRKA